MSGLHVVAIATQVEPAWLTRVRLRARRRALWLRYLWSSGFREGEQSLAISHSEVDRILSGQEELAEAEWRFYAHDDEAASLTEAIITSEERLRGDERWTRLCLAFDLIAREAELLSLTAAAEADPALRRVYGYLQDDAAAAHATPWLAGQLFGWPAGATCGPDSALTRWLLARPLEGAPDRSAHTAPWIADPSIVGYLLGNDGSDPSLAEVPAYPSTTQDHCLYPEQLAAMYNFVQAMEGSSVPIEIEILGSSAAGKATLAAQLIRALQRTVLSIDPAVFPPDSLGETSRRAARTARLRGAIPLWRHADRLEPAARRELRTGEPLMLFTAERPMEERLDHVVRRSFRLPALRRSDRRSLWRSLTHAPAPGPLDDWPLNPGDIVRAAQAAPAGDAAVAEVCRQLLYQDPGELFVPLPCPYDWEDLVLSPHVERHLRDLADGARLRWSVYEDWGFERLVPMGRGISALFAGPSGTGKTMSAQVLARALGLELYRVDLAGVMNKYIGETEKRLRQVFERCERASVLLFFDEADALFGQRTQVKDAHDRFANIEIDYLLQRMEQFDGIAVLSTNRKSDIDNAFLRRLRFIIDFQPPGPAERRALWQRALLQTAPDGEEIVGTMDWTYLAERLIMTGADIKAAALNAAFLARAEGTRVEMRHVVAASRRELAKHGVVLHQGEYDG